MLYLFKYQTASFIERCYHGQGMCSSLTTACSDRKMDAWMSDCYLYGLEGQRWTEEIEGRDGWLVSSNHWASLWSDTPLCPVTCFNCLLDFCVSGAVDML